MATWPLVLPSPIIPNSTVPAGCKSVEVFFNPSMVIDSRVEVILLNDTSPLLTHGTSPFQ